MENDKIDDVVNKYVAAVRSLSKDFDKMSILLPNFIFDFVVENSNDIKQVKMNNSIFITLIVDEYYNYLHELYNIDPSNDEENESSKYRRKQLAVNVIPETTKKIEDIKRKFGTSDRVGVVKAAIEHFKRNHDNS